MAAVSETIFPGGAAPEPTEAEAEPDPDNEEGTDGGTSPHEADMDEPDDAEPTTEEYNDFFNTIMAL